MKKILLASTFIMASSAAQSATLAAGQNYNINILADGVSCFAYGYCADVTGGSPYFTDNDNDAIATADSIDPSFGSAISGDGLAGVINISTTSDGAGGVTFSVNSFNMDTYLFTPGGFFASMVRDPSTMSGGVDADGNITLDVAGRTSMFQYFDQPGSFGEIDNPAIFTSGTQQYLPPYSSSEFTLTGITLSQDGSAVIVSSRSAPTGAVSAGGWGILGDGAPLTEVFSLQIVGGDIIPSAVPVPAALWLFGSGIIGLVGFARRKKA